jgi:hypothetical protein
LQLVEDSGSSGLRGSSIAEPMSQPRPPKPAKLVIGLFLHEKPLGTPVVENLMEKFGDVDIVSAWMPFDQTTYYEPEMGAPLYRRMMAFETLIHQSELAQVKLFTNEIEKQYADNGKRVVNIDPGYMLLERFVLATGKNFAHRIYIGKRIYADLTLVFRKGRFEALPWSFPDYAGDRIQTFLMRVRDKYAKDLKR